MSRVLLIIKIALKGVSTNKVRSFLTVLGIVIGIAAVITLLSLGEGAQTQVTNSISSLGSDLVIILPGQEIRGPAGANTGIDFTERDYNYLSSKNRFPNISTISPYTNKFINVQQGNNELYGQIKAVAANFDSIQELVITDGRFLSENDVTSQRNVVVIGPKAVEELFPKDEPEQTVGKEIKIKGLNFKVIGVLGERDGGLGGFNDPNLDLFVPYTTAGSKLFENSNYSSFYLTISDKQLFDATILQIEQKFSDFRGVEVTEKDFTVFTAEDILNTAAEVTGIFTTLLASIAAISLLVGGIGISNIMLVSVTERTKEIGLRKALGAKKSDILWQFLLEAIFLTLLGGLIGILLGVFFAFVIGEAANIPANLSLQVIFLATSVSALVGIIFGFFPSWKAAGLDPIVALRYE